MAKILVLTLILILDISSAAGYFYITQQINAGSNKIADGEQQIAAGEQKLAKGKARLSSGEKQLSQAKEKVSGVKTISYGLMAALPVAGQVAALATNKMAEDKIKNGELQVADGNQKIKAGEERLAAGKKALSKGKTRLAQAKDMRTACGIGTILFSLLFIVIALSWRRSAKEK